MNSKHGNVQQNDSLRCRICTAEDKHPRYSAKEMMFGTRDEFEYFQCVRCECLQISEFPENISSYYPADYTSLSTAPPAAYRPKGFLESLRRLRSKTALFGSYYRLDKLLSNFVGYPTALFHRPNDIASISAIIRPCNLHSFKAKILDVGCGNYSQWLAALARLGFNDLRGIDPFIEQSHHHGNIEILKSTLQSETRKYNLITFHHALEHIPDQIETLHSIRRCLDSDGVCVIRIPIVPSTVWEEYRTDWVELDAPRHFYLHSIKSIESAAKQASLEIFDIRYDTTCFEFYGSEMYRRGIPLTAPNSPWVNNTSDLFSNDEMETFKRLASEANRNQKSGRAVFYLRAIR